MPDINKAMNDWVMNNQHNIRNMMGVGGGGGIAVDDEGDYWTFKRGNNELFKVQKSDSAFVVTTDLVFGDAVTDTLTISGALTSGADGAGVGDVIFYGADTGKKVTWDVSENMLDVDGIMKIHNRPVSTDTYALEVKTDYAQASGVGQGALQVSTRVYPTTDTTTVLARGGYFQCQLHADDAMTDGGMMGLYTQVHNNGTGVLNGSSIIITSLKTDIADGGTWTEVERLCSLHVESNLAQAISAGSFHLLYISNTGATVADTALNIGAGTYTTGIDMSAGTITTDLILSNGATIVNTDVDNLKITEANIELVGSTAVTLNGDTTVSGTKTFTTGTGNVSLNGDTTIAAGKVLYIRDASQSIASGSDDLMTITSPTITLAGATAINLDGSTTISGAIVMDSAVTTGISITGATTTGMSITGSATDAINIDTGTFTNGININGGTISKAIRMGSYSSRLTAVSGATTEVCTIGILGAEDDFTIGYGSYIRTSGEDGKGFGASFLVEATNTTGTPTLQGLQSMAFLGSVGGSEAAHLKTLGGDATAGLYGGWFKIGANSNCVADSGSRAAALWVDNQMSGTISGEEYGIFATTGASKPDSFIGFETSSSGWASLFYFDETSYDQDPVVSGDASAGGSKDYHLKVNINGTMYGLQLYSL